MIWNYGFWINDIIIAVKNFPLNIKYEIKINVYKHHHRHHYDHQQIVGNCFGKQIVLSQ